MGCAFLGTTLLFPALLALLERRPVVRADGEGALAPPEVPEPELSSPQ